MFKQIKQETESKKDIEALFSAVDMATNFAAISIGLASPDVIRSWSYDKVKKPETINYRTFRPERDGLFCERIFGPNKDWECFCGKYKSMRYKGVICDRCGVEVTHSEVRRQRMGHIELVTPVSHIWYFKRVPSPLALALNISIRDLERVLYYEGYIVLDVGENVPLEKKDVLSDDEYRGLREKYGTGFEVGMGAEAIKRLLKEIDVKDEVENLRLEMEEEASHQKKRKIVRRLEILEAFLKSGNKPEWMILDVIPVIPPELRPMVQLDGGRFATSDLNDLYRRVINRNNRLERLMALKAPDIIIRNEKRMMQESVDALFDNGRRGRPVRGTGNRPLKSLSDMLKGKQGRFRQNLLGKRVDYSGRSVIVVDPTLKLHQCGLPKKMALELFKPFIMRRLVADNLAHNIKSAKRMVERESSDVWDVLEEVILDHPVLLNRAPTLHRAGIQGFMPVLIEGDAIKIHPLVCTAFNADFDGDQMAVHIPLSIESQIESQLLMLAAYNLLSPANGGPLVTPTQDIILGLCYLTKEKPNDMGEGKMFSSINEALMAQEEGLVGLNAMVFISQNGKKLQTTIGRFIFNECLPEELQFINNKIDKKKIGQIVIDAYRKCGMSKTITLLDKLKQLGFYYATVSGASIGIDDIKTPDQKAELLKGSYKEIEKIMDQYQKGVITEEERYNKVVDLWTYVSDEVARVMYERLSKDMDGFNSVYMMIDSGARGSKQQVRQLAGMRGLMAKPSGEIIELPITSNFREGLTVLEYFISTHGARKGLADTALKTADAGYLTRRLVDVSQDVIINIDDCETINGIVVEAIKEGDEIIEPLGDRILGRISLDDVVNPMSGEVIIKANEEITEDFAAAIEEAEIDRIRIRSVLTCETPRGVCAKCYGRNLATGKLIDIGEAIGIIAAQSVGEPGTQLTMRTFHIGGTAYRQIEEREIKLPHEVEIVELPRRLIQLKDGTKVSARAGDLTLRKVLKEYELSPKVKPIVFDGLWVNPGEKIAEIEEDGQLKNLTTDVAGIIRIEGNKRILIAAKDRNIPIKTGGKIFVDIGDIVPADKLIAEVDPYNEPILSEVDGTIQFKDIIKDRTMREELDENTGLFRRVIIEDREGTLQPRICVVRQEQATINYIIPNGARVVVNDGDEIPAGTVIAKFPQELIRTKDITGGLPRVAELFEARRPKEPALVTEIDGVVKFKDVHENKRVIMVENETTKEIREYEVSMGKHLKIHEGDELSAGDQLTEGPIDPHDILKIKGERKLQEYLLNEIQEVYRLQGVNINDKHIEVITRQMLRKLEVTDTGDTTFLLGEQVDKFKFNQVNESVQSRGKKPAQARPILMGITKASLSTESFISAASFQETTKVLTEAAIQGKIDQLHGLKENVVIGRLIPAGTGVPIYNKITAESLYQTESEEIEIEEKVETKTKE
ncbi:MAG: DNA-directed RNA polymerase subunit beta' [bacterium]|nr:DNA-directed RNA polymerase subunit beta' [bacterium]